MSTFTYSVSFQTSVSPSLIDDLFTTFARKALAYTFDSSDNKVTFDNVTCVPIIPTSHKEKKTSKSDSPAPPSEEEISKLLKSKMPSIFSTTESNCPWFESLFASAVPKLTPDSTLTKADFNPLFTDLAQQAKTYLRSNNTPVAHLPKSIAAKIQQVILSAVKKSSTSKAPAKIVKKAQLATPPAESKPLKTKTPRPSTDKKPSPASAAPAPHVPFSTKKPAKTPSVKTSIDSTPNKSNVKKTTEQSTTVPTTVRLSDVLKALHESSSPQFYFAADNTPTFKQLYPGTSQPRHSYVSGNVKIAKDEFQPLLLQRIKSAHAYLSKRNLKVTKLPAKFLAYQTRLICRSIEQAKEARKALKQSKKPAKPSKTSIEYVPQNPLPAAVSSPVPVISVADTPDYHDTIKAYRDLRSILQAYQAEIPIAKSMKNPSLAKAILESTILQSAFPENYANRTSDIQASLIRCVVSPLQSEDPRNNYMSKYLSFVNSRSSIVPLPSFD